MAIKLSINNLKETSLLAQKIAPLLIKGDVICLQGDLGAGKTAFARFLIQALCGNKTEVLSPTFNLVHLYDADEFTIWHFDLYRLEHESEIEELGIFDAFDEGVSIIEWPQIIDGIIPDDRLLIDIKSNNDSREFVLKAYGTWQERIRNIGDI